MKPFIKKHEYNSIKKYLYDLNNALVDCKDINIVEATRAYTQDKILNLFKDLSQKEITILDISKINSSLLLHRYLENLDQYVYGMQEISKAQILKLFKKEKKLKLPNLNIESSKSVYLGWIDESTRKLFLVYNMNGIVLGMSCKILNHTSNNTHICTLCNYIGHKDEVTFVSSICKTSNSEKGTYRTIGFEICLDSTKCNERISSIEKLERLLQNVNNINQKIN